MADSELKKYLDIYKKNPKSKIFAALAEVYRKNKKFDEAIEICTQGMEYHPDYPSAHMVLGRIYYDKEKLMYAKEEFNKVLKSIPDNKLALSLLGDIYMKDEDYKNARNIYKKLLFFNPNQELIKKILDEIDEKEQEKKIESTKKDEEEEQRDSDFNTDEIVPTETLGDLFLSQGYKEIALSIYETLNKEKPNETLLKKITELQGTEAHNEINKKIDLLNNLLTRVRENSKYI